MSGGQFEIQPSDELLIVSAPERVSRFARERYPRIRVTTSASYYSAMPLIANRTVRWVLCYVNPEEDRLTSVVQGMREAAGAAKRIVLCCTPATEQATRRAIRAGADDYILDPLLAADMDTALQMAAEDAPLEPPVPTTEQHGRELDEITQILNNLDLTPGMFLDRIAELVRVALGANGVNLVVDGVTGGSGEAVNATVLMDHVHRDGKTVGRISLGPCAGDAYSTDDAAKLSRYASLVAGLLDTARQQQQWRTLAYTDDLSQLPNRRFLFAKLAELLDRAAREHTRVTALICDIDDFKRYNDTYGHGAGDEIIRDTGRLLRKHCRKDDHVVRYGGDEFVIIFWDADQPRVAGSQHPKSALHILERFREALSTHEFPALGPEVQGSLTISGGLATFPWDADNAEKLLERADEALLQAKRSGKNRIFLVGRGSDDATDVTPGRSEPFGTSGVEQSKGLS